MRNFRLQILTIAGAILLTHGCQSESTDSEQTSTQETANTQSLTDIADSDSAAADSIVETPDALPETQMPAPEVVSKETFAATEFAVEFSTGAEDSPMAPRYSPPGKGLPLTPVEVAEEFGLDGLETQLVLGWPADKQTPIKLLVTRATAAEPYTRLFVDSDRNGEFNEPAITVEPSVSRGNIWSSFSTTVPATYFQSPVAPEQTTDNYAVNFWLVAAAADERPEVLRVSRRGFKTADVRIGDQSVSVVLSDSNNDAIFGEGDWYELKPSDSSSKASGMRKVGDFAWLEEAAFKLELDGARGGSGRLVPHDPGMTREEDLLARDPYGADRKAVKAEQPLQFRHDVDAAIAEAAEKNLPCFIKFETTWCGPCKMMTQNVFTAKDVVDSSEGVVCVKVDGDERKDLLERYAVKAFPTGIMLAGDTNESGRFVGYQSVAKMTAFLKEKRIAASE